jgi:hypothetical protein
MRPYDPAWPALAAAELRRIGDTLEMTAEQLARLYPDGPQAVPLELS